MKNSQLSFLFLGIMLFSKCAPRTCGDDPGPVDVEVHGHEVLPAHAGMIPVASSLSVPLASAPRTCGDDPERPDRRVVDAVCSPHMRG